MPLLFPPNGFGDPEPIWESYNVSKIEGWEQFGFGDEQDPNPNADGAGDADEPLQLVLYTDTDVASDVGAVFSDEGGDVVKLVGTIPESFLKGTNAFKIRLRRALSETGAQLMQAATAEFIIVHLGVDFTHIQIDDTITLQSTDGTVRTYTAKSLADAGDSDLYFSADGDANNVVNFLEAAINSAGGHNGKIVTAEEDAFQAGQATKLILTQAEAGHHGNTKIFNNLTNTPVPATFTGGTGAYQDHVYPEIGYCYSAVPGRLDKIVPGTAGDTIIFSLPPLPLGQYDILLYDYAYKGLVEGEVITPIAVISPAITVKRRNRSRTTYSIRKRFPKYYLTGPKGVRDEKNYPAGE